MINARRTKTNQKVRNATPNIYDNIKFRSKLETYIYKQLKAHNIYVEYEPLKFELVPAFKFLGKSFRAITYTPDFIGNSFIIEAKGHPNDSFPMKWKMFLWYLLNTGKEDKYRLFVVHNQKEADECIKTILNSLNK